MWQTLRNFWSGLVIWVAWNHWVVHQYLFIKCVLIYHPFNALLDHVLLLSTLDSAQLEWGVCNEVHRPHVRAEVSATIRVLIFNSQGSNNETESYHKQMLSEWGFSTNTPLKVLNHLKKGMLRMVERKIFRSWFLCSMGIQEEGKSWVKISSNF